MLNNITVKNSKIFYMSYDFSVLKDRLAYALKLAQVTQMDLARQCKVSHPVISQILSGQTTSLKGDFAVKIADFLGVNLLWLLVGKGEIREKDGSTKEKPYPREFEQIPICIARLNNKENAMQYVFDATTTPQDILVRKEWFERQQIDSKKCVCITVPCDSMQNFICKNDLIMVDTSVSSIEKITTNGGVFLIGNSNGELGIHRIIKQVSGRLILTSDNKLYPQEIISLERVKDSGLILLGKVILKIGTEGL